MMVYEKKEIRDDTCGSEACTHSGNMRDVRKSLAGGKVGKGSDSRCGGGARTSCSWFCLASDLLLEETTRWICRVQVGKKAW